MFNFLTTHGGLLVCGLFLLTGLGLTGDYGVWVDELNQRDTSRANLNYILGQVDSIETRTPLPHDRFYGVAFELPLLLAEEALGLEDYYDVHRLRLTVTHLFFAAGGFFCYLLAYRLFNNRWIALFALLLFLLHPRIYAHSFFNSKDLPFLSMFAVALYLTERAFRKDTAGAFLLLGIAVGLLTNLRIMGLMLFAAVIGMRVLDAGLARDWGERRRIIIAGGLFALAAGLVWHGLTPNAWSDPMAQLVGALRLTTDYPNIVLVLFQGERIWSDELPAHFGLTWFMITTPPPVLLLGVLGIAAVSLRGLSRPGTALVNRRRRFWLLLAGCFGLPLLAVALAGSTMYDGWRPLYFIYVPIVLLAARGLYWTVGALSGLRWRRAVVYGLIGLGLAVALLQMAQLHPLQSFYFNFLVDRVTPNHLREYYRMRHQRMAPEGGWAYLLQRHPGETLAVNEVPNYPVIALPPAERRRLTNAADLDYALIFNAGSHQPDLEFNTVYAHVVFNNDLMVVKPLKDSRMERTAVARYRELYQQAAANKPISQAEYDLYLQGRRLTLVRDNCPADDRAIRIVVKVYRAGPGAEPGQFPAGAAVEFFDNYGVQLGNKCLAVIGLPDYPVEHIVAGQYAGRRALWESTHSFSRPGLGELAAELGNNQPGVTDGAAFELYRQSKRLIYYREGCVAADTAPRFYLHITPEDAGDLRPEWRGDGFESRDFHFGRRGLRLDEQCVATVELPDYPIAGLRTGQGKHWEFRGLPPVAPGILRERVAALTGMEPNFRGEFDLFWRDGELIYRREGCAAGDTAAGFFLHIRPVNGADLAAARREYGFESRDFEFNRWGGHFDGECVAVAPLPGYAIAGMRTGQYVAGRGEVWSAELGPP